MKWLKPAAAWREMVLATGRSLMSIATTNRAILQRYRIELDELRAARLASVETERELRDRVSDVDEQHWSLSSTVSGHAAWLRKLSVIPMRMDTADKEWMLVSRLLKEVKGKHNDLAKSLGERVDDLEGSRMGGLTRAHVKLGDTVIALGDQMRRADDAAKVRLDALEATVKAGSHTLQVEPWIHGRSTGGTVRNAKGRVILHLDRLTLCEGDLDG